MRRKTNIIEIMAIQLFTFNIFLSFLNKDNITIKNPTIGKNPINALFSQKILSVEPFLGKNVALWGLPVAYGQNNVKSCFKGKEKYVACSRRKPFGDMVCWANSIEGSI